MAAGTRVPPLPPGYRELSHCSHPPTAGGPPAKSSGTFLNKYATSESGSCRSGSVPVPAVRAMVRVADRAPHPCNPWRTYRSADPGYPEQKDGDTDDRREQGRSLGRPRLVRRRRPIDTGQDHRYWRTTINQVGRGPGDMGRRLDRRHRTQSASILAIRYFRHVSTPLSGFKQVTGRVSRCRRLPRTLNTMK
jgi:hypothetical protein